MPRPSTWILALGLTLSLGACAGRSPSPEGDPSKRAAPEPAEVIAAREALPPGLSPEAAAEWILDRSAEVTGSEATSALTSRKTVAQVSLARMGIIIRATSLQLGMDKVWIQQDMPGLGVSEQGYDGQIGWSRDPITGLRQLEGGELEELRRGTLGREADYRATYERWILEGIEVADGQALYHLALTPYVGDVDHMWIDATTLLLRRQTHTSDSLQGSMEMDTWVERHQRVDGIQIPMETRTAVGPLNMQTRVESVEHGVPVDPAIFQMPTPEGGAPGAGDQPPPEEGK